MKNTEKRNLEYLQLLESLEVMLMNGNSINPNSVIRRAIQVAIGKDVNLNQNNMKQTAVEWLVEKLKSQGLLIGEPDNLLAVNQAKEMEKEQIIEARNNGFLASGEGWNGEYGIKDLEEIKSEQYYNETFK